MVFFEFAVRSNMPELWLDHWLSLWRILMRRFLASGAFVLIIVLAGYSQPTSPVNGSLHASYSKGQAASGKALYEKNCSSCHRQDLKGNCPAENLTDTAYVCSATGSAPPLVGTLFLKRWYSVADLYGRV